MKNLTKYMSYFCCIAFLCVSCKPSAADKQKEIAQMEENTYEVYDTTLLNQLISAYKDYVKAFPQDSLSPEYLLRAGCIEIKLGKGGDAIQHFDRIINYYPQYEKLPEVYYYKAYTYEAVIFDIAQARAGYTEFINRFPEHSMVTDAQLSIKYLGMSPEEIVASFNLE
ncbi:MAG: tetratricopeptide repeat protein [Bacteroidales bacterium]|nr:tetratricopeptide repeat protein [Bacteroidales bacterium]